MTIYVCTNMVQLQIYIHIYMYIVFMFLKRNISLN